MLAEAGAETALPADALFGLALLLAWPAWPFGDDAVWSAAARRWAKVAASRVPESRRFREWRFFLGEVPDTAGPKVDIAPEAHARYHGRGAFGARVLHLATAALFPAPGRRTGRRAGRRLARRRSRRVRVVPHRSRGGSG